MMDDFCGYEITVFGINKNDSLTYEQEKMIMDVVLLSNEYERLKRCSCR